MKTSPKALQSPALSRCSSLEDMTIEITENRRSLLLLSLEIDAALQGTPWISAWTLKYTDAARNQSPGLHYCSWYLLLNFRSKLQNMTHICAVESVIAVQVIHGSWFFDQSEMCVGLLTTVISRTYLTTFLRYGDLLVENLQFPPYSHLTFCSGVIEPFGTCESGVICGGDGENVVIPTSVVWQTDGYDTRQTDKHPDHS